MTHDIKVDSKLKLTGISGSFNFGIDFVDEISMKRKRLKVHVLVD